MEYDIVSTCNFNKKENSSTNLPVMKDKK